MMHLVTGRSGGDHVNADDIGMFNARAIGSGRYALSGLEARIVDSNTLRVSKGDMLVDGRYVRLVGDEDVRFSNGTPSLNRIDLVVARYAMDLEGYESARLVVLEGASMEGEPVDPPHSEGLIHEGDEEVDVPLYRITVKGLDVSVSDLMVARVEGALIESKADRSHKHSGADVAGLGGKVLWEGGNHMTSDQECVFSEDLREQPNGLVLEWAFYTEDGQLGAWNNNAFFVPKEMVVANEGASYDFLLTTESSPSWVASKLVYLSYRSAVGYDGNDAVVEGSGIKFNNNRFYLKRIWGV